jgi:D-alanine-D-alanine ligase
VDGGEREAGNTEQRAWGKDVTLSPCSTLHAPCFILKSVLEHASFAIDDASIIPGDDLGRVVELVRECESRFRRPYYAEEFIEGREFNLALLGDEPTVLPPAEIDFSAYPVGKPRIIGRDAKFDTGSFEYENTPRRYNFSESDQPLIGQLTELAAECWRLFDLAGYARVDFRVDADNRPWILEINANPCPAPDSGFAAAAAEAGIEYEELIERILADALERSGRPYWNHRESRNAHAFAR